VRANNLIVVLINLARNLPYFRIEVSGRLLGCATANCARKRTCKLATLLKLGLVVGLEIEQRVEPTEMIGPLGSLRSAVSKVRSRN